MQLVGGMLTNWGGEVYKEDTLPDHLAPEERSHFAKRYSFLKEEFYRQSGGQVVTPANAKEFLKVHRRWSALTGRAPLGPGRTMELLRQDLSQGHPQETSRNKRREL